MAYTKITADGLYPLNNDMNTSETTIYVGEIPAATTIAIGFNDPDGNWTPFPNSTLTSHTPLSISHGHDVMLIALAVDVSGEINISTKKEGLGSLEGLLNVIADNTQSPIKVDAPVDTPSVRVQGGWLEGYTKAQIDELLLLGNARFSAYTLDGVTVSKDPLNPTYLDGVTLFPSSSADFQLIYNNAGESWIKNVSSRTVEMVGDSMWQLAQGAGSTGEFVLWSERSSDDGETYFENDLSLRKKLIPNNSADSVSLPTAVGTWAPDECIRWAMYNKQSGDVILATPTDTVNGNPISGIAVYWRLEEI
ncbi:hypothetical protein HYP06_gp056 [Vibrio phage vB_VspP_pVa5]|uniref:Uncharacterized protein n=1 Tax=Vibrio phage vB_VspP_pVa5 TaxID=1913109 RepID=A0A1J0GV34_9CAUD|nr:hypothetical protein HYP06_gp056 [Vibrio phage vB_VspP_pVa5]APC46040.1 hypothetical protein vBVspPpVa5_0056 [Vibrio phage vB_VspP_pVa5]